MQPEGQAVAGLADGLQHVVDIVGAIAHHMQDRTEHLAIKCFDAIELEDVGRHERTASRRQARIVHARRLLHTRDVPLEHGFGLAVDHRTDVGRRLARIADPELARSARDHLDHGIRDIVLQA